MLKWGGEHRNMTEKKCIMCPKMIRRPYASNSAWWNRAKFCSSKCKALSQRGKLHSEYTKKKMSLSRMGRAPTNKGVPLSYEHRKNVSLALSGEKHWNWKGGITSENHIRRNRMEYTQWRETVFTRDGFKCKIANADCVHEVHAHHILRFSEYPELRYQVSNGITLCKNHHPLKRSHEQELAPLFKRLIS